MIYFDNMGFKAHDQILKHISHNTDRLSLIFSFLYEIFNEEVELVSEYQYDEMAEKLYTLQNLRPLFLKIKEKKNIPDAPYLYEVASSKDYNRIFKI